MARGSGWRCGRCRGLEALKAEKRLGHVREVVVLQADFLDVAVVDLAEDVLREGEETVVVEAEDSKVSCDEKRGTFWLRESTKRVDHRGGKMQTFAGQSAT